MGKKGKKKGNAAEKTAARTDKNLAHKQKKELKAIGEDDIEKILQDIEKEAKKRSQVTEIAAEPPSRRINFTLVPHPEKDELIFYGGEYYNGQKTFVYDDLFFYNIPNNTWTVVKSPNSPPPRCAHQMITTSANKGELWLFGGEYASPTQSQFYHYRDLWVYYLKEKRWDKIAAPNGPSGRSGHRMVCVKKKLFVFGGFHDNLRECKYYNDVHCFDMEEYKWVQLEVKGTAPSPRSGCTMIALPDGKILVTGGYCKEKIKKDVEKGVTFTDSFLLAPDKHDTTGLKYKWSNTKLSGVHFTARCGMSLTVNRSNAYIFGGVYDVADDEEDISSTFFDGMYTLDLEKLMWRDVQVSGKKEQKARRRKLSDGETDEAMETEEEIAEPMTIADDGVFKVTISAAPSNTEATTSSEQEARPKINWPTARMNAGIAVKNNILYLYGGMFEDGDKEVTLADFYALDLKKLDEWKIIINDDLSKIEWIASDDESGSSTESDEEDEDESD